MLISNWMTKDPISVLPSTPLSKCQKLMKLRGIHRLPVVDDDNKVVGIVSDRDVKSNLPSKATTLSVHELQYLLAEVQTKEFMTPSPLWLHAVRALASLRPHPASSLTLAQHAGCPATATGSPAKGARHALPCDAGWLKGPRACQRQGSAVRRVRKGLRIACGCV